MPEEFGVEVEQSVSGMMKRVSHVLAEEEDRWSQRTYR